MKKVLFIGLDCLSPQLTFERWIDELPNIRRLMEDGVWGELESIIPPITVPAWACMFSGKDPGELGIYGFRNRKQNDYELSIVSSKDWKEKAVWDYLSEKGLTSIVIGVPPSYPPKDIKGAMISCFLTPSAESSYSYPPSLKDELSKKFGELLFDVKNFRREDKISLLKEIYELTNQRFELAKYLLRKEEWDFFAFVEMGPDRFHHGFWKYFDPAHIKYQKGNEYENSGVEYYRFLDRKIGELLEIVGDETTVIVASDHGAQRMDGGICINEWLIKNGYLTLKEKKEGVRRLSYENIDWSRTIAWGEGGYYGRIFINLEGREPEGIVKEEDYEGLRNELIERLERLGDEEGKPIGTKVLKPEDTYRDIRGFPPDLIVLFGNLFWRSVGSVGLGTFWVHENDTGPDDANHSLSGLFIIKGDVLRGKKGELEGVRIYDIAKTLFEIFQIEESKGLGKSILER